METAARRRLGDIFVERGLITDAQLREALDVQKEQGGKLGEILVELGFVTRVGLASAIAEHWDDLVITQGGRKAVEAQASRRAAAGPSAVERLTAELAERDRRIASLEATIATLVSRLGAAEGPSAA